MSIERVNKRKSNIELLRIIAMVLIIMSHLANHGVIQCLDPSISYKMWKTGSVFNKSLIALFSTGGDIGSGIFLMITGYFGIKKVRRSYLKPILEVIFYAIFTTIIFWLVAAVTRSVKINQDVLMKSLSMITTPVTSGVCWFVSAYFIVLIVSPLLNRFILSLNEKGQVIFALVFWTLWFIIPSEIGTYFTIQKGIFYYIIGAQIRINNKENVSKIAGNILLFIISMAGFAVANYISATYHAQDAGPKYILVGEVFDTVGAGVLAPISAYALIIVFINMHVKHSNMINKIAATTFGVFLLHDSPLIRILIWYPKTSYLKKAYTSSNFLIFSVLVVLAVFVVCSVIDCIRMQFEPIMTRSVEKLLCKVRIKYTIKE